MGICALFSRIGALYSGVLSFPSSQCAFVPASTKNADSQFDGPNIVTSKPPNTKNINSISPFSPHHGQYHADHRNANVDGVGIKEGPQWLEATSHVDFLWKINKLREYIFCGFYGVQFLFPFVLRILPTFYRANCGRQWIVLAAACRAGHSSATARKWDPTSENENKKRNFGD